MDHPNATIMSTLERAFQRGKAEGRAEARAEGRAEALLRVLELRFEQVPDEVRQAVMSGSAEQSNNWAERVLTAKRPEDVIAAE
tara:strand:+ start:25623 stop:25874 length:252 start_codon:yes stop_codon:yes gene_type:complete